MTEQQTMKIDFVHEHVQGPVYSGRDRGEQLREIFKLDDADASRREVEVKIPNGTYSVTSSFFLGMFGPSVIKEGSADAFFRRYHFDAEPAVAKLLPEYVRRALRVQTLFG